MTVLLAAGIASAVAHKYPTSSAFVHVGDWDAQSRLHPVMKWLEDYYVQLDHLGIPTLEAHLGDWWSQDMVFIRPDGLVSRGREEAFAMFKSNFASYTEFKHVPNYQICIEREDNDGKGYDVIGTLTGYRNYVSPLPQNDPAFGHRPMDKNGYHWDSATGGAWSIRILKDKKAPHGFLLKSFRIDSDTAPIFSQMIKRGMVSAEQLGMVRTT